MKSQVDTKLGKVESHMNLVHEMFMEESMKSNAAR